MHPYLFEFSGLLVPTQIFIVVVGLGLGLVLYLRQGYRYGLHWKILLDGFVGAIVGGILGGRLFTILLAPGWFFSHMDQLFALHFGGMNFYGGLLGGAAGIALVAYWYGGVYLQLGDQIAALAPLACVVVHIGSHMQGAEFGSITTMPWGVVADHASSAMPHLFPRHPVALYAALLYVGCYGLFFWTSPQKKFHGQMVAMFAVLAPVIHEFMALFRDDVWRPSLFGSVETAGFPTANHLLALLTIGAGVALFLYLNARRNELLA